MNYIKPFEQITIGEAGKFGGKVASLGEMLRAGLPVPNGFGISIDAHRDFMKIGFSREFEIELAEYFRVLNSKYVAVRSSAVAEDSGDASWAGQLETYLNTTKSQLEANIWLCWKSIDSIQAKDYAKDKSLSVDDLLVGVGVQAMLSPESAGVMFTVNPVSGDKDQIMIEGSYGLGEMVVQGAVTPDNYIVSRYDNTVTDFNIAIKEKMMIYKDGANQVVPVPEIKTDRAILREHQVLELAGIGLKIEGHYGMPMDIEWAYQDGKFFIVQARPITTL